jgi:Glycosyltransferase family 87
VRRLRRAEAPATAPLVDALLYGASALFALRVLGTSTMLRNRTWADLAWPVYAAGAGAALLLAAPRIDRALLGRLQLWLAAAVALGTVVAPLALEVHRRGDTTSAPVRLHPYAASEVVVTEGAAGHLLDGRDPYSAPFDSPELAGRKPSTAKHFPYLPGMIAFGLPRALVPHARWSDARLFFLLATIAAAALAWRRWRAPPEHRLRALQVLIVLPTGAAALVTGGDDLPVLALCLLALVLFDAGRHAASAGAAGCAALLKLTAWPLLLVLAVPVHRARVALGVVAVVVIAVATAGPADFADDVLLFPTGLTNLPSPAATTTLGSIMIAPVNGSPYRILMTLALLAVALLVTGFVLRALTRRRRVGASEVAAAAAVVLLALIVLAPVARAGYAVYPLDLIAWAALLRSTSHREALA